jgi:hypothetical protein
VAIAAIGIIILMIVLGLIIWTTEFETVEPLAQTG